MHFKLDHIGLVVEKIDDLKRIMKVLNPDTITEPLADPIQKVAASFVGVDDAQGVYIELLEPTASDSPVNNFLKKRGGGLHHLCFEVDDIDKAAAMLTDEGFRMVSPPVDCPTYDANLRRECTGMTRIAFFILARELLIELIEKAPQQCTGALQE